MPLRRYKHPASPPSSDGEDNADQDEGFILDPDQNFDELPQPFRLIDKTLCNILDKAWEFIEQIESERSSNLARARVPVYDTGKELTDFGQTTCMTSTKDGRYVFIGDNRGITAVEAMLSQTVATYEETQDVSYVDIDCCALGNSYLISTLDDAGNMKLLCFSDVNIHLVKLMNEQDSGSKTMVASGFNLSHDANYIAVCWEVSNKETNMEVYKIPQETWLKELETAKEMSAFKPAHDGTDDENPEEAHPDHEETDQSPASSRAGSASGSHLHISFTRPALILRIHPPVSPPAQCSAASCSQAQRLVDGECSVIGSGSNHTLLSAFFQNHNSTFESLHENQLKYLPENDDQHPSSPTCHFLAPGRLIPGGSNDPSSSGRTNSLVVWWSGSTQLFIYSLVKTAKDVEHKADIVWPHAQKITCSSVSWCTTVLALGLVDGTLVTYDMQLGQPLQVMNVSNQSPISFITVLPPDAIPESSRSSTASVVASSTVANIIVCCKDGTFALIQCGIASRMGIISLNDKILDDKEDIVVKVHIIPRTFPYVILVIRQSGKITMQDVAQRRKLCHIKLPLSYKPTPPISPCLSGAGHMLYLKGAEMDDYDEEFDFETSCLFLYPLLSLPSLAPYRTQDSDIPSYVMDNSIETRYNSLIQERIVTQGTRQLRMQARWSQFQTELKKRQHNKQKQGNLPWLLPKANFLQEQDVM